MCVLPTARLRDCACDYDARRCWKPDDAYINPRYGFEPTPNFVCHLSGKRDCEMPEAVWALSPGDIILFSSERQTSLNHLEKTAKILSKALVISAISVGYLDSAMDESRTSNHFPGFVVYSVPRFHRVGNSRRNRCKGPIPIQLAKLLRKSILGRNMDSCLAILHYFTDLVHTVVVQEAGLTVLARATMLHTAVISIRAEALQLMKARTETLD
ncbi:hypothetical protein Clacol_004553 [Clathrus columnatus]|uniref:Uncharacterized protein n=1 Tax=Clathrus columnatus TaxID=1419009 RepID=A0AAV5A9E7_9AGAM|nr:hypothetical protein Clacol_004553 [Clathrus columnatus]